MSVSPPVASPDMDNSSQTDTSSSSPPPTLYNAIDIEDWASARAILLASASSSTSSSHTIVSPVDYVDEDGVNCLHLASYCRDLPLDLLRSLLNDPSSESALIANDCGRTPLHFAIKKSDDVRIRMMVDACPRAASVADKAGQTALHLAIVCCRSSEAIHCLLSAHPSNATTINNSGETPLKILFQKWSTGLENVLLSSCSSYIYLDLDRDVTSFDGKMRRKLKWIYEVTILLMGAAATGVVEPLPLQRSLPWLTAMEEAMCPAPFASLLSRMKEAAVVAPRSPTTSSLSEDGNETCGSDGLSPAAHLQIPTTTATTITTTTTTTTPTVPQSQTSQEDPSPTAKVIVAGGGVVSLSFVSLLMEYGRRRRLSFEIDVYVGSSSPPSFDLYRLDQIDEGVWENLPSQWRDDIFPDQMNDGSSSSSKIIARQQLQERLFELVNDSESVNSTTTGSKRNRDGHSIHSYQSSKHSVNLIESELTLDLLKNEESSYDFLVLAEDDESNTDGIEKQICPGAFGPCVPYPEDPESKFCEDVLSILFETDEEQQDDDIMNTITETFNLSQNRFVLLSLPSSSDEQQRRHRRRGYLNMWLLTEEAEEVGGLDSKMQMGDCGQMNCLFLKEDGSRDDSPFKCQTHGAYFTPSIPIMRKYSKLWHKITDGLKLFNIPQSCIKGFSRSHRRPYKQRVNFTSTVSSIQRHLHETTHNYSKRQRQQQYQKQQQPPMSFLIGTSAFSTSYWMGNALSTHLQGAVSLARTVTDVSERGKWHAADFTRHSSVMYALQDREVRAKELSLLLGPQFEDEGETMNDRIKRVLEKSTLAPNPTGHDGRAGGTIRRQEYEGRLRKIFEKVITTRRVDKIRIWNVIVARIKEISEETLSVLAESGESWMTEHQASDMKLKDIIPEPKYWQENSHSNNSTSIASSAGAATRGMTRGSRPHPDSDYIAPKVFGTFNGTSFVKST